MTDMNQCLPVEEVQFFLDQLEPMGLFKVIFLKNDGTQAAHEGCLDPASNSRANSVPIMTEEGWKRFNLDRVLWIGNI